MRLLVAQDLRLRPKNTRIAHDATHTIRSALRKICDIPHVRPRGSRVTRRACCRQHSILTYMQKAIQPPMPMVPSPLGHFRCCGGQRWISCLRCWRPSRHPPMCLHHGLQQGRVCVVAHVHLVVHECRRVLRRSGQHDLRDILHRRCLSPETRVKHNSPAGARRHIVCMCAQHVPEAGKHPFNPTSSNKMAM